LKKGNDDDFECLLITYNNNNDVIGHTKLVPKFLVYKEETFTKCEFFFSTMFGPENFTLWKFYKEILVIKKFGPLFSNFKFFYIYIFLFIYFKRWVKPSNESIKKFGARPLVTTLGGLLILVMPSS